MQEDLGWSFAAAGSLNSANAFGHLAGALLAIWCIPRLGGARTIVAGAVLTSITIAATPLSTELEYLLAMRFAAGLTGALSFVAGGILAARAASELGGKAALGVGVFYGGPGVGIILSAAIVPGVVDNVAAQWPSAWYGMGIAAGLMTLLVIFAAAQVNSAESPLAISSGGQRVSLLPALAGYTLYAAGYVGYITFIIANVREQGGTVLEEALWWSALGLGGVVGGAVWTGVIGSSSGRGLALLTALTGVASIVPMLGWGASGFAVSFVLFGLTFLSVVAATTNLIRLARPVVEWGPWIAYFTIAFGVGQTIGPLMSGAVADWVGSTDGVLWVSSLLLFFGAGSALFQRPVNGS